MSKGVSPDGLGKYADVVYAGGVKMAQGFRDGAEKIERLERENQQLRNANKKWAAMFEFRRTLSHGERRRMLHNLIRREK